MQELDDRARASSDDPLSCSTTADTTSDTTCDTTDSNTSCCSPSAICSKSGGGKDGDDTFLVCPPLQSPPASCCTSTVPSTSPSEPVASDFRSNGPITDTTHNGGDCIGSSLVNCTATSNDDDGLEPLEQQATSSPMSAAAPASGIGGHQERLKRLSSQNQLQHEEDMMSGGDDEVEEGAETCGSVDHAHRGSSGQGDAAVNESWSSCEEDGFESPSCDTTSDLCGSTTPAARVEKGINETKRQPSPLTYNIAEDRDNVVNSKSDENSTINANFATKTPDDTSQDYTFQPLCDQQNEPTTCPRGTNLDQTSSKKESLPSTRCTLNPTMECQQSLQQSIQASRPHSSTQHPGDPGVEDVQASNGDGTSNAERSLKKSSSLKQKTLCRGDAFYPCETPSIPSCTTSTTTTTTCTTTTSSSYCSSPSTVSRQSESSPATSTCSASSIDHASSAPPIQVVLVSTTTTSISSSNADVSPEAVVGHRLSPASLSSASTSSLCTENSDADPGTEPTSAATASSAAGGEGGGGVEAEEAVESALTTMRLSPSLVQSSLRKYASENSQGSMDSYNHTPSISRDNSTEAYTDSTGVDLEEFIKKTLNKNPKDRQMLYGLENDLTDFINDNGSTRNTRPLLKFPAMTSYHRMLVHRVAAFFGLEHNVDQTGKCIVVNKTANTRIPDFKFKEQADPEGTEILQTDHVEPRAKRILQRDRDSINADEQVNVERDTLECMKKSKSLEERQEQYVIARNRIFDEKRDPSNEQQNFGRFSHNSTGNHRYLFTNDGHNWPEPRLWSSTDSSGYGTDAGCTNGAVAAAATAGANGATAVGGCKVGHRGASGSMTSGGGPSTTGGGGAGSAGGGANSESTPSLAKANSFHAVSLIPQRKDMSSSNSMDRSLLPRPSLIVSTPMEGQTNATANNPTNNATNNTTNTSSSHNTINNTNANGHVTSNGDGLTVYNNDASLANDHGYRTPIWVASSFDTIPAGSLIIDPSTGAPFLNSDGMPYKWQGQMMNQLTPMNPYISGQQNPGPIYQDEGHMQYPLTAQSSTKSTNEMAAAVFTQHQQHQQQQQQQQLNNQIILQHQLGGGQVIPNAMYLPNQMAGVAYNGPYQTYNGASNPAVPAGQNPATLGQQMTSVNQTINNQQHINNGGFIANDASGQSMSASLDNGQAQAVAAGTGHFPVPYDPAMAQYSQALMNHQVVPGSGGVGGVASGGGGGGGAAVLQQQQQSQMAQPSVVPNNSSAVNTGQNVQLSGNQQQTNNQGYHAHHQQHHQNQHPQHQHQHQQHQQYHAAAVAAASYMDPMAMTNYQRNTHQQQQQQQQQAQHFLSNKPNDAGQGFIQNNNPQPYQRAVQYYQMTPNNFMNQQVQQTNSPHQQMPSNYHNSTNRAANQCTPVSISPQLTSTPPNGQSISTSSPLRSPGSIHHGSPSFGNTSASSNNNAAAATTASSSPATVSSSSATSSSANTTSCSPMSANKSSSSSAGGGGGGKSPYRQRSCEYTPSNSAPNSSLAGVATNHRDNEGPAGHQHHHHHHQHQQQNQQQQNRNNYSGAQFNRSNSGKNLSRSYRLRRTHSKEMSSPQNSMEKDDDDMSTSHS